MGECIDQDEVENYLTGDDYFITPCDGPHDNEVYYIHQYPAGPFPGDDAVADQLDVACEEQFEGFVGRDYQSSRLGIYSLFPNEALWDAGEQRGECMVYDYDSGDPLTGSAYQSGW